MGTNYKNFKVMMLLLVMLIAGKSFAQGNTSLGYVYPKPFAGYPAKIQALDVQTWYGVIETGTFFKTTNAGINWSYKDDILIDPITGWKIEYADMEFINSQTGWLGGYDGVIAKTTDAGNTWLQTPIPGVTSDIYDISFLNDLTGYAFGRYPGILGRTTDGGVSWNQISSLPGSPSCFYVVNSNVIYFGANSSLLYKSTNGGFNWSSYQIPGSLTTPRTMAFANDSTGVVSCGARIYATTNGGVNWTNRSLGLPPNFNWPEVDLLIKGDSVIAYITGKPEYIYKDVINNNAIPSWDTIDFRESPDQYTNTMYSTSLLGEDSLITAGADGTFDKMYSQADKKAFSNRISLVSPREIWASSDGNKIFAVGNGNVILQSTDAGANWDTSIIGSGSNAGYIDMLDDNTGWILGSGGKVYRTTTGGSQWILISAGNGNEYPYDIDFATGTTGWRSQYSGVGLYFQKTTNGGANWEDQTLPYVSSVTSMSMVTSTIGYVTLSNKKILKTINGGDNWQDVGATLNYLYKIFMVDANTGWVCGSNSTLKRTTDGGASWDSLAVPFPNMTFQALHFFDQLNGIVCSNGGAVLKTSDGGNTWQYYASPGYYAYGVHMVSPNKAYIAENGEDGIIKYEETLTGITYTGNEVPDDYGLEQNYPNPFNPTTTIKFSLPKASTISLKVYDMTGREVASLFNNKELNAGTFEQRFNDSNLASGVYFYTLVADGQLIASKKMMLIK